MDLADLARAIFALAVTLGVVGLAAVSLRKFGPDWVGRLQTGKRVRRLSVVESLVIDPQRRLVLVRLDGAERLLLLGEGRLIAGPSPAPAEANL